MAKRHTAAFVDGANGTYTLVVTNVGTTGTTGLTTVAGQWRAGVCSASGTGAGWSIAAAGGTVTATHNGPIAVGDSLVFDLTVNEIGRASCRERKSATVSAAADQ